MNKNDKKQEDSISNEKNQIESSNYSDDEFAKSLPNANNTKLVENKNEDIPDKDKISKETNQRESSNFSAYEFSKSLPNANNTKLVENKNENTPDKISNASTFSS